jgi:hypothetical protein
MNTHKTKHAHKAQTQTHTILAGECVECIQHRRAVSVAVDGGRNTCTNTAQGDVNHRNSKCWRTWTWLWHCTYPSPCDERGRVEPRRGHGSEPRSTPRARSFQLPPLQAWENNITTTTHHHKQYHHQQQQQQQQRRDISTYRIPHIVNNASTSRHGHTDAQCRRYDVTERRLTDP